MSSGALRALLVDASDGQRLALRAALEEQFAPLVLDSVSGAEGLADALMRRGWDVVLYSGDIHEPVPPRKARALVSLSDPHLPLLSVAPAQRSHDLIGLVKGFDGGVPVVGNPSQLPGAILDALHAAGRRRHDGDSHRMLRTQQAVTDQMASVPMPEELLERVTAILGETLEWSYAELWRPADGALVCTSAWAAPDAGERIASLAGAARGGSVVPGRGLPGRVFAFRHPEWVEDLAPEAPRAAAAGLASGVAFPITMAGRCDGAIALYASGRRAADAETLALFAAVGAQLARYVDSRREQADPLRYRDVAGTMILLLDPAGRVTRANRRICEVLGRDEASVVGQDWFELAAQPDHRAAQRDQFERLLADAPAESDRTSIEHAIVTAWGGRRTISWHATVLRAEDGTPTGLLASGEDVTETRLTERKAEFLAYHDPVTGLPNRALLDEHLKLGLARARRTETGLALLHIDLDNFKLVNDSLGRAAGDELLSALAVRLQELVRPTDLLARVGSDEFLLLVADLTEDPLLVAERIAREVVQALGEPFRIGDTEFQVSASIGVSCSPRDAHDAASLLAHADAAMYQAKQVARGGWAVYNPEPEDPLARLSLAARLRRALRENQFVLHYQPIIDLDGQALVGVEALLRWNDPEHGMVSPADFVPVAEETGLIEALGDWVVRAVCKQQVAWAARGLRPRISFNVAPRQLRRLDFAERVAMHLAETGADPTCLTVELTESATLQDHLLTEPILHQLDEMGLNIALDDFGTGYSSLSRLREMPVGTLKIDRAFLRGVPESSEAAAIVTAILRLSRALGRTAIAEGVETEEQRRFLEAQRCPLAQGFLFGRPVPAAELEDLMLRRAA